jgi:alkylation response protein AidB-like acyl-CoA dehydrogenase
LAFDELNKDIWSQTIDVVGAGGLLYDSYAADPDTPMADGAPQMAFLRSRANSIEGGTTEVMKNIIGERVLGLPGDARVDRDVPWNQVPRS